jgi:hypothetical protein
LLGSPYNADNKTHIDQSSRQFTLYSGGDEKAIRIFEAPIVVLEGLSKLSISHSATSIHESQSNKVSKVEDNSNFSGGERSTDR